MQAELRVGSVVQPLEVLVGTEGEMALDVSQLKNESGLLVYDPGYDNTAAFQSRITFASELGFLRYRGYAVEDLVQLPFLDVAQLLIFGDLPDKRKADVFRTAIDEHAVDNERWIGLFRAIPSNSPPFATFSSTVNMLSLFFPQDFLEEERPETFGPLTARLFSMVRTLAAFSFRQSRGEPFEFPGDRGDYISQFLKMLFWWRGLPFEIDQEAKHILEVLLVLHADHEQNCGPSVRLAGGRVGLYSSVCAGLCTLGGSSHNANQRVIRSLEEIAANKRPIGSVLESIKDRRQPPQIPGFGHPFYKTFDPRARILKELCLQHLLRLRPNDPVMVTALALEEAVLNDAYFIQRNLYPNVDFYSGLLYRALGIPSDMLPVMFALGRLPGWIAYWKEMNDEPSRATQPRQLYVGPTERRIR